MGGGFAATVDLRTGEVRVAGGGPAVSRVAEEAAGVEVLVSASVEPRETAERLLRTYLCNPAGFDPPRDTEGSFLIVDCPRRRVCFGRDRSAGQHLYASVREQRLYLGSELRPFLGPVCERFDPLGVAVFLSAGLHIAPFPLYEGLAAILPGHWHVWAMGEPAPDLARPRVFWRVERTEVPADYRTASARYADLLSDRIRRAIGSGGAGVYLSGGSDSATVVGALVKLGVRPLIAAHMHVPGHHDNLELALVQRLHEAFGFHLAVVRPRDLGDDRIEFIRESCRLHVSGSYPTFPGYRLCARALADGLPAGSVVFNGELCLLDVGFSTANEGNLRHLRRWLYRGGGRYLARFGPVVPQVVQEAALASEPRRSKPWKLWYALLDTATALGRPELFFAGLKFGFRGFPGISRFAWDVIPPDLRAEWLRRVKRFFAPYLQQLQSPDYSMALATLTTAWYCEASNFTMAYEALDRSRFTLCFPFDSPQMMDFAASLPEKWAKDKRIQKDMSRDLLGLPPEVSHVQKDHSRGRPYFEIAFSDKERAHLRERVASHPFGVFQPFADRVLAELPHKWIRWHDVYLLYWIAEVESWLNEVRRRLSATDPFPPQPTARP